MKYGRKDLPIAGTFFVFSIFWRPTKQQTDRQVWMVGGALSPTHMERQSDMLCLSYVTKIYFGLEMLVVHICISYVWNINLKNIDMKVKC